jgi:hypothetical protein
MNAYYEKIIDLWKAGKEEKAVLYFWDCKGDGLLSEAEIKELDRILPCDEVFIEIYKRLSPHKQEQIKRLLGI